MQRLFKREEKRPFTYSSIEERRGKSNYSAWIISVILIIGISVVFFLIL